MRLILTRQFSNEKQTLGRLSVVNSDNIEVYVCKTLELPFNGNQRRISAIPCGKYKLIKRKSERFNNHFHVLDVPNRDMILIHQGNFHTDILGCILVGQRLQDIGKDKNLDVVSSATTLELLLNLLPAETTLTICNDATFINVDL